MIVARKIPEFYIIFARKMPEFYIIIARKIFFPNFRGARASPSPVSYAYAIRLSTSLKIAPMLISCWLPLKRLLQLRFDFDSTRQSGHHGSMKARIHTRVTRRHFTSEVGKRAIPTSTIEGCYPMLIRQRECNSYYRDVHYYAIICSFFVVVESKPNRSRIVIVIAALMQTSKRSYVFGGKIRIRLRVREDWASGGGSTTSTRRSSTPSPLGHRVPRETLGRRSLPDGRRLDEAEPLGAIVGRSGLRQEQVDAGHGAGERVLDVVVIYGIFIGFLYQWYYAAAPLGSLQRVTTLYCLFTPHLRPYTYSVSPKIPPEVFWHSFPNGGELLVQILHAYYTFLRTLVYKFLSNYYFARYRERSIVICLSQMYTMCIIRANRADQSLLAGKSPDRDQSCTRWSPGKSTYRVCSRSRSRSRSKVW